MIRLALVVCVSMLVGCGQQSATVSPAPVSHTSLSDVSVSYDEFRDTTSATLTFDLPGYEDFAMMIWTGDGKPKQPYPIGSLRGCVTVNADAYDFAALADGERFVAERSSYGFYCIGIDALRAMATASDVRISVGMIQGPLPPESKLAIAEYLAMFAETPDPQADGPVVQSGGVELPALAETEKAAQPLDPSGSIEYDEYDDETTVWVTVPLHDTDHDPTLTITAIVDGEQAPPLKPGEYDIYIVEVDGAYGSSLAILGVDRRGVEFRYNEDASVRGLWTLTRSQIAKIANAKNVSVRVGSFEGEFPERSLAALVEYLALFR